MKFAIMSLLAIGALSSCMKNSSPEIVTEPATAPAIPGAVPPSIRNPNQPGGVAVKAGPAVRLTPEEDIVFTDPDNPDTNLPELATLLAATPKRRGPWEQSETIAKRRAAREGKPLLIWFTDSARSPMCKALTQELFNDPEFETWAAEKLVRLRIDTAFTADDSTLSLGDKENLLAEHRDYVSRLKKQYKVLGHPALIMLNPSSEVIGTYRGYQRGEADFKWGLLKQAEASSSHFYQEWRKALEAKGYREWRDRQDRKVFAKLANYSKGTLTLVEPDGSRSRTHENKLSDEDREWLAEQKRMRGL